MEELKRFLNDKGILKEYLQAISDERTGQNPRSARVLIRNALTAYHDWRDTSRVFPGISDTEWEEYHSSWYKIAPDGHIESTKWLIKQLSNKKLRLLNAIKDFR